jgi:hypothetical protein
MTAQEKLKNWVDEQVALGKKKQDVAARLGLPLPHLYRYISGEYLPKIDRAHQFEKATGGAVRLRDWVSNE